ncbi:hypothetical protein OsI_29377 [Oryza sativa Indica Group]|uniref:Uncharacterized protein n=1 Tax=Oryza sativa subsp. indica TaxID=39946 RepID=B8BB30_ORYSI|nr:hypothetical protein OsI_29377 [Oryza sativa Indica Group]
MGYGLTRLLLVALAALSLLTVGGLDDHHAGLSLAALPRDGMSEPAGPAGEGHSRWQSHSSGWSRDLQLSTAWTKRVIGIRVHGAIAGGSLPLTAPGWPRPNRDDVDAAGAMNGSEQRQ